MIRYFLISFNLQNIASCGNILLESDTFPSKNHINNEVMKHNSIGWSGDIIILNIFEFRSEEDYKNFIE